MLRTRLEALRQQAGLTPAILPASPVRGWPAGPAVAGAPDPARSPPLPGAPAAPTPLGDLARRLARLGSARAATPDRGPALEALCRLTGAVPAGEGLVERRWHHPMPFRHGRTPLAPGLLGLASVPLRRGSTRLLPAGRVLFLDTETSGLAGGTGTFVFLLGLARVRDEGLELSQHLATGFAGEAALLRALESALDCADCLVTYNGKSFDVPLLRTRLALARRPDAFAGKAHGDLLHATRRLLARGWPDCRLQTAEREALGFTRTDDLPGAQVPQAWQCWLRQGEAAPLAAVLAHNRDDLLSLAALLSRLNALTDGLFADRPGPVG